MTDRNCEARIDAALEDCLEDLQRLWAAWQNAGEICPECEGDNPSCWLCAGEGRLGEDGDLPDLGNIYEYGLAFDYVAPGTFQDQAEAYFRYQLSWGGPSTEFRIFADKSGPWEWSVYRIEFWFLDWFDGAHVCLGGEARSLLEDIFRSLFVDTGTADHIYDEAIED